MTEKFKGIRQTFYEQITEKLNRILHLKML